MSLRNELTHVVTALAGRFGFDPIEACNFIGLTVSNETEVRPGPASKIAARKYDTAKHAELHLLKTQVEHLNIPFDEAAERKWCEIWGTDWKTTCCWTGQHIPTGRGLSVDHLFPIRGAYGNSRNQKTGWLDGGLRGSDSSWNRAMVLLSLIHI